ncbi:hypothetical protein [Streptomyces sp. NBC_01233]|nr:hypothetical protein OG332_42450 [Streptomyces sp. NBC_01233]
MRGTFRELAQGLLMELEDVNCWTLAEAVGLPGPHRAKWWEPGTMRASP